MSRELDQSVRVKGLKELQRSLKKAAGDADKELRKDMRAIGLGVKSGAAALAPTGPRPRHGSAPPLAGSLRVSVTSSGVSVYSQAAHAFVQDRGGRVGNGAIIPRAHASGYLTKAIAASQRTINADIERLLDKIDDSIKTT